MADDPNTYDAVIAATLAEFNDIYRPSDEAPPAGALLFRAPTERSADGCVEKSNNSGTHSTTISKYTGNHAAPHGNDAVGDNPSPPRHCSSSPPPRIVFDFTQWTSSFTMEQIPSVQMMAWVKATVDRIMVNCGAGGDGGSSGGKYIGGKRSSSFSPPRHVLDVGCGTGLLFFEWLSRLSSQSATEDNTYHTMMAGDDAVVPSSFSYIGIDFSSECIEMLKQRIAEYGLHYMYPGGAAAAATTPQHVRLLTGAAHQVAALLSEAEEEKDNNATDDKKRAAICVDTILMNSVVMYFPSIDYFNSVLRSLTEILLLRRRRRQGPNPIICGQPGRDWKEEETHNAPPFWRNTHPKTIFCGDVRDSRLLRVFYYAIALSRESSSASNNGNTTTSGGGDITSSERSPVLDLESCATRDQIDASIANDPHLLVSPLDFIRFAAAENASLSSATTTCVGSEHGATPSSAGPRKAIVSLLLEPKLSAFSYKQNCCPAAVVPSLSPAANFYESLDNEMNRFRFDATIFVDVGDDGADDGSLLDRLAPHCRVQLAVADTDGELLTDDGVVGIAQLDVESYLSNPQPQHSSDPSSPRDQLFEILNRITESLHSASRQSSHSPYGLFIYPHVPPLIDALTVEPFFNREGAKVREDDNDKYDGPVATIHNNYNNHATRTLLCWNNKKAIRAATLFDTPLELLEWFMTETSFGEQWQLKLTLHPSDPLSLICIVAPKNAVVRVDYTLVVAAAADTPELKAHAQTDAATKEGSSVSTSIHTVASEHEKAVRASGALLRLGSSQPSSSPRQAHFSSIPDVIDGWVTASVRRINSGAATANAFVLSPLGAMQMGEALWKSIAMTCRMAMPHARAIYQPSASSSSSLPPCRRRTDDGDAAGTRIEEEKKKVTGGEKDGAGDGISWSELALWSDALSEHLLSSRGRGSVGGTTPGSAAVVIQFVDRSFEQIVGMFTVFGIGAIFVPLAAAPNPDPPARIAKIFADCKPSFVLTQPHLVHHIEEALLLCPGNLRDVVKIVCAIDHRNATRSDLKHSSSDDDNDEECDASRLETALQRRCAFWEKPPPPSTTKTTRVSTPTAAAKHAHHRGATVNDPSYYIYTSGSTGEPKAVVLTHANFHNLVCAFHFGIATPPTDADGLRVGAITRPVMRTLQTTAASFDLHVYECLAPLYHILLSTSSSSSSDDDDADAEERQQRVPAAELVLLPPMIGAMDLEHYATLIDHGAVTHVVCTPTMLASLAEYCSLANCWRMLRSVEVWRTGGEALKQSTVDTVLPRLREHNPTVELWCSYGPAECTDSATMSLCETTANIQQQQQQQQRMGTTAAAAVGRRGSRYRCTLPNFPSPYVPIGRPIANYGIYIVVEEGPNNGDGGGDGGGKVLQTSPSPNTNSLQYPRLARAGEVGMIYLSGPGVFKGYLGRDDLTNSVKKQMRIGCRNRNGEEEEAITIYRTGDLGKYTYPTSSSSSSTHLAQFWHVGRADFSQVKLRGQRIETTEIEAVLMQHDDVGHAIVTKWSGVDNEVKEEFLVAFFSMSARDHKNTTVSAVGALKEDLKSLAQRSFPSFMVPSSFTFVETFVTNRNGKIDRKMLPAPDMNVRASTSSEHTSSEQRRCADESSRCPAVGTRPMRSSSPPTAGAPDCTDLRLIWLRQQVLSHWLATVPSPHLSFSSDCDSLLLASSSTRIPTCTEPIFTSGWIEMGASSITLMRFIGRLKIFMSQWLAAAAAAAEEVGEASQKSSTMKMKTPIAANATASAALTFPMEAAVSTPRPPLFIAVANSSQQSQQALLLLVLKQSIEALLTFPSVYRLRNINALTERLAAVLFPQPSPSPATATVTAAAASVVESEAGVRPRTHSLLTSTGPVATAPTTVNEAARRVVPTILHLTTTPPEPSDRSFKLKWSLICRAMQFKRRIATVLMLLWSLTRLIVLDGPLCLLLSVSPSLMRTAKSENMSHSASASPRRQQPFLFFALLSKIRDHNVLPGSTQQSVFYLTEENRIGGDTLPRASSTENTNNKGTTTSLLSLPKKQQQRVAAAIPSLKHRTTAPPQSADDEKARIGESAMMRCQDEEEEKDDDKQHHSANCPYVIRITSSAASAEGEGQDSALKGANGPAPSPSPSSSPSLSTTTMTLGTAQRIVASLETITRDVLQRHPAVRVRLEWDGDRMLQRVFSLIADDDDDKSSIHGNSEKQLDNNTNNNPYCRFMPHHIFASEEEAAVTAAASASHFAFSPAAGEKRTPLIEAVQRAARQRISSEDKKCLFRFEVFYELPLSAKELCGVDVPSGTEGPVDPLLQCPLETPVLSLHAAFIFHHSVFDGHSMTLLLREIVAMAQHQQQLSAALCAPQTPLAASSANQLSTLCSSDVPPSAPKASNDDPFLSTTAAIAATHKAPAVAAAPAVNYREDPFFKYCANVSTGQHLLAHKAEIYYWLRHMEGWRPATISKYMPRTITPEDGKWPSPDQRFFRGVGKVRTFLTAEQGDAVRRLCGARHWTPYSFFMACYYLVLAIAQKEKEGKSFPTVEEAAAASSNSADGGSEEEEPLDLCIGSPFSTRLHAPELQERICCFSDIYPFRVSNLKLSATHFDDFVDTVQEMSTMHMDNAKIDVGTIIIMMAVQQSTSAVTPARTPIANPLFAPAMLYEDAQYAQKYSHVELPLALLDGGGGGESGGGGATVTDRPRPSAVVNLELLDAPDFGALFELQLKVSELRPDDGKKWRKMKEEEEEERNNDDKDVNAFALTWEFADELYDLPAIHRIARHYAGIVEALLMGAANGNGNDDAGKEEGATIEEVIDLHSTLLDVCRGGIMAAQTSKSL